MSKVINPEGEAALLEAALSVAGERLPWINTDSMTDGLQKAIREGVRGSLREAAKDYADEIVAWVMQSEVWFGHCTDDDIILEVQSEGDTLFSVTLLEMLLLEVEIMDDVDTVEGTELSSREFTRRRLCRTLRTMADRVEQYHCEDK